MLLGTAIVVVVVVVVVDDVVVDDVVVDDAAAVVDVEEGGTGASLCARHWRVAYI